MAKLPVAVMGFIVIGTVALGDRAAAADKKDASTPHGAIRLYPTHPNLFQSGDGKPLVLIGDYTWGTFSDTDYDYRPMLDTLQCNGLNFSRVWVWWGAERFPKPINRPHYTPYRRTGPGMAQDGKPKYDLTQFNPAFFKRLRAVCQAARKRGIVLQLTLFDAWMIKHPHLWKLHAFHRDNNINNVDGDPGRTGTGTDGKKGFCSLGNSRVLEAQQRFIRRTVDAVGEFDNIFFEIANENYYNGNWERQLCRYLHDYERTKPLTHLVMPLDLPNHDGFGRSQHWNLNPLHRVLLKNLYRKKPLILDTDGMRSREDRPIRQAAWTAFVSGGHFDYLDDSLQVGDESQGNFKGSRRVRLRQQLGRLARFTRQVHLEDMLPDRSLVKAGKGFAMASRKELLAYLPEGGKLLLNVGKLKGGLTARWYNPRDGRVDRPFPIQGAGQREFTAPDDTHDWVLHVAAGVPRAPQ